MSLSLLQASDQASSAGLVTEKTSTAIRLEYLSLQLFGLINTRDWDSQDWIEYLHEDVLLGYAPTNPPFYQPNTHDGSGREAMIERYKALVAASPDYNCEVLTVEAIVDEVKGIAEVWSNVNVTGDPPNVVREAVCILYWRRLEGRWVVNCSTTIRGMQL